MGSSALSTCWPNPGPGERTARGPQGQEWEGRGHQEVPKAKGEKEGDTNGWGCQQLGGDTNVGWEGRGHQVLGAPTWVGKKWMPVVGKGYQEAPKAKGGNGKPRLWTPGGPQGQGWDGGTNGWGHQRWLGRTGSPTVGKGRPTWVLGTPTWVGKRWMPMVGKRWRCHRWEEVDAKPPPGTPRDATELSSADVRSVSLFCSMYDGYIMTHIHDIPSLRKTAKNGPCVK